MPRPATDKRERLVVAAAEHFHQQGYPNTSLADVAKAAGIAPGNVFYYFKTKDELAKAVIDTWVERLTGYMAQWEVEANRWLRLERFVDQAVVLSDMYVALGCPLAGLTRDLRHAGPNLRAEVPRVYAVQYEWLRSQFRDLGFTPDEVEAHTRLLMASMHGAILLAYAQGDSGLIVCGVAGLRDWLRGLQKGTRASRSCR
jgi:AcrR family transcriptional regulator